MAENSWVEGLTDKQQGPAHEPVPCKLCGCPSDHRNKAQHRLRDHRAGVTVTELVDRATNLHNWQKNLGVMPRNPSHW